MEKEIDSLIDFFERYKLEIESEIQLEPENQFLKGKEKGIQHALTICRMYNMPEEGRNYIDIEIDVPVSCRMSRTNKA
ncbi:hypothetical protein YDYSY3_08310 [Paenibacillus chitinolyticus]|uniref:hypothetical protein n=1 Tax=Paenibacillus chitinolyticus TaxID=79263 RepID=UPI0026E4B6A6|nr:hypothetical protein [Paenibacillus chitinolyticus]GKS09831.1 hypothetical protein YDYSY3_08310 [Paenibacillus chitinolyticus]